MKLKHYGRLSMLVVLAVCLFACALFMGNSSVSASAEEAETETNEETLTDELIARLKEKYGEDYELYYNTIIKQWGSAEEYLLSLAENGTVPDVAADGWAKFVTWLGTYSPVWGSILAVIALVIAMLFGKKVMNRVAQWNAGTGTKFKSVVSAFNTLYQTSKAQNAALIKLLGENERFAEERKALEKATEELDKDEEI